MFCARFFFSHPLAAYVPIKTVRKTFRSQSKQAHLAGRKGKEETRLLHSKIQNTGASHPDKPHKKPTNPHEDDRHGRRKGKELGLNPSGRRYLIQNRAP